MCQITKEDIRKDDLKEGVILEDGLKRTVEEKPSLQSRISAIRLATGVSQREQHDLASAISFTHESVERFQADQLPKGRLEKFYSTAEQSTLSSALFESNRLSRSFEAEFESSSNPHGNNFTIKNEAIGHERKDKDRDWESGVLFINRGEGRGVDSQSIAAQAMATATSAYNSTASLVRQIKNYIPTVDTSAFKGYLPEMTAGSYFVTCSFSDIFICTYIHVMKQYINIRFQKFTMLKSLMNKFNIKTIRDESSLKERIVWNFLLIFIIVIISNSNSNLFINTMFKCNILRT